MVMLPGEGGEEIEVLLLNNLPRLLTRFISSMYMLSIIGLDIGLKKWKK